MHIYMYVPYIMIEDCIALAIKVSLETAWTSTEIWIHYLG